MRVETVSVIVPVYRTDANTFQRCIRSIVHQTYGHIEIIIVDDGNGEAFQSVLADVQQMDDRIRIIHQENAGVSCARNRGIDEAKGTYLSFIDSDDEVDRLFVERMVEAIQGADLAICGVWGQDYPTVDSLDDRASFFSKPEVFNRLQYTNFSVNKLYQKHIVDQHQIAFPKGMKLGEDAIFVSEYLKHCGRIHCISDQLYHYVDYAGSAMSRFDEAFWPWESEVISAQWAMFHQYPLDTAQEQAMIAWLYGKLRGVIYAYLDHDASSLNDVIHGVMRHPLFGEMQKCDFSDPNGFLTKKEKSAVRLWNRFGYGGIVFSCLKRKVFH